jgi:hypothetical protein
MKTVSSTVHTFFIVIVFLLWCSGSTFAQAPAPRPTPSLLPPPRPIDGTVKSPDDRPLTTFEEEMRAKRAIKLAEKEYEENLKRAREISQIGKELQADLKNKSTLDRASLKKIERLEKLTKKIRGEAGGEEEEVDIVNRPSDLPSALTQIAETSDSLSRNVQETPRQVVSASVIGNANVLLELIKMLRVFAGKP